MEIRKKNNFKVSKLKKKDLKENSLRSYKL